MKKLLIVEDDDLSQKVLKMIFIKDYEMDFCESAEEFYEKFSKKNYDLIIMDISLKGTKNGFELMKEMKAIPLHSCTPILCFTAHAQAKMRETAFESGTDLFITKPVSNKVLKEAVLLLLPIEMVKERRAWSA